MDTFTKLLAIEVPENTALRSAELTFRGLIPWWLAGLIFVALLALTWYLYSLERGTMGRPRRVVMVVLRVALFGLLLLLLARPVLLAEFEGQRPRGVVVLVDNTQSMTLQDRRLSDSDRWRVAIANELVPAITPLYDGKMGEPPADTPKDPQRADLVRAVFKHRELKLSERLQKLGPLRTLLFGVDLRGTSDDSLLGGFRADESRTALADAVLKALQAKDADPPTAIVAVTDGQDNGSKFTLLEAAQACKDAGIPLHIYGVGTAEGGNLQLREVAAPETLFVDDSASIPLRWRAQGFKAGNVEITLLLGGAQVARKVVPVQTGEDLREVLTFTVPKGAEAEEARDLTATIRYDGADGFRDALTRSLRVVDRKIKVLIIENAPRWEYKFLQPALLRDRRVEPHFLLVQADPKVAQSGPPFLAEFPSTREEFFESRYNLIILGDVAASYLGKEHMEWIRDFVQNRGGLIVLAGRQHMPAEYENTPLAEVLPVEFRPFKRGLEVDVRTQEYPPTLTEAGERSEMLALADTPEESLDIWHKKLPGFHWHYPLTKLRPGAQALVVNPRAKMGDQPMPLVATQYYGRGQVVFLGSDETWRWRWNHQDKYFVRFWGQLIYQTGLPSLLGDSARRVQAALERSQAVLGQPGSVFVRLLDKNHGPRRDAQVEATLEYMDARPGQEKLRKVMLQAIPGRPGEYRALLTHDRPGRFELRVNNPEVNTFSFQVELPPHHELEESGLAEKALRDMALLSGGSFYREEDLHRLPHGIELRKVQFTRRQEVLLWGPLTMMLFVGLITAEWLVRKFSNLS